MRLLAARIRIPLTVFQRMGTVHGKGQRRDVDDDGNRQADRIAVVEKVEDYRHDRRTYKEDSNVNEFIASAERQAHHDNAELGYHEERERDEHVEDSDGDVRKELPAEVVDDALNRLSRPGHAKPGNGEDNDADRHQYDESQHFQHMSLSPLSC